MGKGDKKSKRGKISIGSFGNSRNKKKIKARLKRTLARKKVVATSETKEKTKKVAKKKESAE